MAWPAMSYSKEPFDTTDAITSSGTNHNDENMKVGDSWEEQMEDALNNLDIELEKVAQKRILEDSQTKMEEDYSEEDTSMQYDDYEDDNRRRLDNCDAAPSAKCEKFEVTFASGDDLHFHAPDCCLGWGIDHDHTSCDKPKGEYPMNCTFYQTFMDTDAKDDVLRQLAFNEPKMEFDESLEKEEESFGRNLKKRGKTTEQQQWFSKAAKKMSEGEFKGSCTPKYHGRSVRGTDCDLCWAGWTPYPCNCNCRGWDHIASDCWRPCSHYNDEYTQTLGYDCWKPCDREGQLMFNVGCGLTPYDRTCASSTGDCNMKYVNRAISILDVLTIYLSGGVAGAFQTAAETAAKADSKSLAREGLRVALKNAGKQFASNLLKKNAIKRKMREYADKTGKELKNQVVEQGAELFLAASMNTEPNWGGMVDEIAEALDPTGIYGLVKGFIPPESCDDSVYIDEDIPDEESGLPELDPLDTIEVIYLKHVAVNPSHLLNDCEGDCDSDSSCKSGKCFQRKYDGPQPPGCSGKPHTYWDYCIP